MKLSVRSKVANGLVICLLVPRVASTAVEMFNEVEDGLDAFSADDGFILGKERGTFAVMEFQGRPSSGPGANPPSEPGGDPTANGGGPPPHPGGDPSGHTGGGPPPHAGGDPTANFDPSGCDPSAGGPTVPTLVIQAPVQLVTAECDPSGGAVDPSGSWDPSGCSQLGGSDFFKVSMYPSPETDLAYSFESTDETEATLLTDEVIFDEYSCVQKTIWVDGQDDGEADGDIEYEILVYDDNGEYVDGIPGVNLDDDNYEDVSVGISEPTIDKTTGNFLFNVNLVNLAGSPLPGNDLVINVTPQLAIKGYIFSVDDVGGKTKMKPHELVLSGFSLGSRGETLVVEIARKGGGPQIQKVFARIVKSDEGLMNSTANQIPPSSP